MAGRMFTYVIPNDAGFAPNPFHGVLTLNCYKPYIRREARVGDWAAAKCAAGFPAGRGLLVYAMRVTDKKTMAEYDAWTRRELPEKIPSARSRDYGRRAGDSMYDFDTDPPSRRRDGFHSFEEMGTDLGGVYTLLSDHFYYFGGLPVEVPEHLRPVIRKGRGHTWRPNEPYVEEFAAWIESEFEPNRLYGMPHGMRRTREFVKSARGRSPAPPEAYGPLETATLGVRYEIGLREGAPSDGPAHRGHTTAFGPQE